MTTKGENPDARALEAIEQAPANPAPAAPVPVVQKKGELTDEELGAVAGGTGGKIIQAKNDMQKAIIQNFRV